MSNHTPGPWFIWKERAMQEEGLDKDEIEFELGEAEDFVVMAGDPVGDVTRSRIRGCKTIVTLDSYDFGDDFGEDEEEGRIIALANARLIAAAPDLLNALKAVLQWIDDNCETTGFESVEAQADAAIAKAEGGAQ